MSFWDELEQEEDWFEDEDDDLSLELAMEEEESIENTPFIDGGSNLNYNTNINPNEDKELLAFNFFKQKGLTDIEAAGIVGNLIQESGMNPYAKGDGGKASYLAQWHPARAKGIKNTSFYGQLDYILNEEGESKKMLNALKKAKNPEEAAFIFGSVYERPGVPHWEKRKANARRVYEKALNSYQYGGTSYRPDYNPLAPGQSLLGSNLQIDNLVSPEELNQNNELFDFGFVEDMYDIYGNFKSFMKRKGQSLAEDISLGIDTANDYLSDLETTRNMRELNRIKVRPRYTSNEVINQPKILL